MSREIEFRGKRVDNDEWVYGYYIRRYQILEGQVRDIIATEQPNSNGGMFVVDPVTVGQYTGLKDKNGVEIYEGDVIDTHVRSGRYMKVYYNEDSASFLTAGLGDIAWVKTGGLGKDMCSYIEVIGNIYENPDLLTQEETTHGN